MPGVLTARPLRGGRRGGPKVALLSLLVHRNRLLVLQIVTFLMARDALTPIFSLLSSARGPRSGSQARPMPCAAFLMLW